MNSDKIWFREVVSEQDPALNDAVHLYEASFPASERINPNVFRRIVKNRAAGGEARDRSVHLLIAKHEDDVIGMAYCLYFEQDPQGDPLHLGYLLYLAVDERCRGLGIGARFYRALTATLQTDAIYRGGELAGIIYEVERPELASSEADRKLRQRRIAFYERLGAHILQGIDYVQPAVNEDQDPVPLYLMYHPLTRDFSPQQLCDWFYELVFGIKKR